MVLAARRHRNDDKHDEQKTFFHSITIASLLPRLPRISTSSRESSRVNVAVASINDTSEPKALGSTTGTPSTLTFPLGILESESDRIAHLG